MDARVLRATLVRVRVVGQFRRVLPTVHRVVAAQGIGVHHREHLGKTLAHLGDALVGVAVGELLPREIIGLVSMQVYDVFLTGCTRSRKQLLLGKHRFVFVVCASSRDEEIVQILELSF